MEMPFRADPKCPPKCPRVGEPRFWLRNAGSNATGDLKEAPFRTDPFLRDALDRAIASRLLCDYGGLTQRQVAAVLGLHSGAAVSAQLQKLAQRLQTDARLRKQMAAMAAEVKAAGR